MWNYALFEFLSMSSKKNTHYASSALRSSSALCTDDALSTEASLAPSTLSHASACQETSTEATRTTTDCITAKTRPIRGLASKLKQFAPKDFLIPPQIPANAWLGSEVKERKNGGPNPQATNTVKAQISMAAHARRH